MRRPDLTPRPGSALAAIGGPWSLSAEMALWTLPFTLATVVWIGAVVARPSLWWVVVSLAAHASMVLLGLAVRPWLLPLVRVRPRPVLMIGFFAAAGLLRGATSSGLILLLGLQPPDELIYRPAGGAVLMVATGAIVAWGIDGNRRHQALVVSLRATGVALAQSRDDMAALLDTDRNQILARVNASLAEPIAELRRLTSPEGTLRRAEVLARLDSLIDDEVKPLSRHLASDVRSWVPPHATPEKSPPAESAASVLVVRRPLAPALHALIFAAISPSVLAVEVAAPMALRASLLGGALVWVLVAAAEWLRQRFLGPRRAVFSVLLVSLISLAATVPVYPIMTRLITDPVKAFGYYLGATSASLVTGLTLFLVNAIQQQRADTEAALRESNGQLAVEAARVSSRLWAQQNRIAQLIHGPVQEALILAVARLSAADRGETAAPSADELFGPLDEAVRGVFADGGQVSDVAAFLERVRIVWSSAMRVDYDLGDATAARLQAEPGTAAVLVAIVRELVNNAYRHGQSTMVRIDLDVTGADRLRLQVASDGPGADGPTGVGLGTRLLDATAVEWRRTAGPDGVLVTASFALAANAG